MMLCHVTYMCACLSESNSTCLAYNNWVVVLYSKELSVMRIGGKVQCFFLHMY
jgi:hypothetical protein